MKTTTAALILNRVIRAPRARVFQAFQSVEAMKQWFGPGPCHVTEGEMEVRQGGAYRLRMFTPEMGEPELFGVYEEVVPNERLRFTWGWRNHAELEAWGRSTVTIEFADHREGTLLTIRHEGLRDDEVRGEHNRGWDGCLEKLVTYAERG